MNSLSDNNESSNEEKQGYQELQNDTDMSISQALDSSVLPLNMGTKPNLLTDESIESIYMKPIKKAGSD